MAMLESITSDCRKRGIMSILVSSNDPVETVVLRTLRRTGLVK
jgi:hypothetical protein